MKLRGLMRESSETPAVKNNNNQAKAETKTYVHSKQT